MWKRICTVGLDLLARDKTNIPIIIVQNVQKSRASVELNTGTGGSREQSGHVHFGSSDTQIVYSVLIFRTHKN